MKATGLFRWTEGDTTYMESFETKWKSSSCAEGLLRCRFYHYLNKQGVAFHNLELIESKIEP